MSLENGFYMLIGAICTLFLIFIIIVSWLEKIEELLMSTLSILYKTLSKSFEKD